MKHGNRVSIEALAEYADRIDVRSPAEFADDHVPGASNHPVLDDGERARVGTLHASDPFSARKLGAALVARNIAGALETAFAGRGPDWRPLVYCWRGGKRSGAMTHVLNEIGWRAVQLDGGYRAYRRHVVAELETLPARFDFVVVCGLTGSGKSRLLEAIGRLPGRPAQVLDLEAIARHRGSLLGELQGAEQPSQKAFESRLWQVLSSVDPALPVFVESESRKIGNVQVPDALIHRMRASACVRVETPMAVRVALLKDEYRHFLADPQRLRAQLAKLAALHGRERIVRWEAMITAGDWDTLVADLLVRHYDPSYERSMQRNFARYPAAAAASPDAPSRAAFDALAAEVVDIAGERRTGAVLDPA